MARLRVRLRFNPGRTGTPMDKLGEFSSQTERFLRSLAVDLGLSAKKGQWLATKFTNDSVAFDGEYPDAVSDAVFERSQEALDLISGDQPLSAVSRGAISYRTAAEFSRIGRLMDPDEKFYIGIYRAEHQNPEMREVTYRGAAEMRQLLDAPITSYGSVQGTLHAWHQGSDPAFFVIRELSTSALVRCIYRPALYGKVYKAHEQPNSVVHVYGDIEWDRATHAIVDLNAVDLEVSQPLSEFEFQKLIGSAPGYTGTLTTDEYIDWIRGDAE
jgi:hypothetical protein